MTVGRIPSVEGGIQPTIVDAKGDLIVATGNDSPNRLAVGANNLVLTADSAQATGLKWAAPDPLTTKGDLFTYSTTEARLGVGANDTVLTADSTAATGLKWATPAAGGMTLLSTTTLSGATVTISSISQSYNNLQILIKGTMGSGQFWLRWNNSSTLSPVLYCNPGPTISYSDSGQFQVANNGTDISVAIQMTDYASARNGKQGWATWSNSVSGAGNYMAVGGVEYASTSAITSITIGATGSSLGGTCLIYGVK